jgi:hypothetical protein
VLRWSNATEYPPTKGPFIARTYLSSTLKCIADKVKLLYLGYIWGTENLSWTAAFKTPSQTKISGGPSYHQLYDGNTPSCYSSHFDDDPTPSTGSPTRLVTLLPGWPQRAAHSRQSPQSPYHNSCPSSCHGHRCNRHHSQWRDARYGSPHKE